MTRVYITTKQRTDKDIGAIEEGKFRIEGDELVLSGRFGTARRRISEGANPSSIAQQGYGICSIATNNPIRLAIGGR